MADPIYGNNPDNFFIAHNQGQINNVIQFYNDKIE